MKKVFIIGGIVTGGAALLTGIGLGVRKLLRKRAERKAAPAPVKPESGVTVDE